MTEEELFQQALSKPPGERAAFLDAACAGDVALRERVQVLLHAHDNPGSFLAAEHPLPCAEKRGGGEAPTLDAPVEQPGTVIGPYKLLEQIGEGGFGVVFMAEQTHPIRRKVALKVLKPGMDTRQVVARFEAERQALALMDHPNIAHVHDGGATPSGRPFFVMELVRGVPITDYCDQVRMAPHARLDLFLSVCQAIQHAHQKGIIHRDVKPSNVLVTEQDGKPLVKVIDFGIAKATGPQLTEKTLFTHFAQMIGTPLYMSPEQAGMSTQDVDTRSDIYSLGVLLYELLTGTTPFDKERLKKSAFDEIRRIIREEDPPKPSARLSDLSSPHAPRAEPGHVTRSVTATLGSISAQRQSEPAKLTKLVRGELDWIVMKALEKDRNRRYETANGFAMDVQRYLADEPVLACPPSAGYRLRKFVRRNRTALAAAGLVLLCIVLVGGVIGSVVRDRAERRREAEGRTFEALKAAEPRLDDGHPWDPTLVSAAQRVEAELDGGALGPEARRRAEQLRQDVRMLAELDQIRRRAEGRRTAMFDSAKAAKQYAAAFAAYGLDVAALEPSQAAVRVRDSAIREALLGGLDAWMQAELVTDRTRLRAVADGADDSAWRRAFREAALARDATRLQTLAGQAEALAQPPDVLARLGSVLEAASLPNRAEAVLRQAQARHPGDFWINYDLGHVLIFGPSPRPDEAVGYFRAAVAVRPGSAEARSILGLALSASGQTDRAIAAYRQAIELDPEYAVAHKNLGDALRGQGKLDEAIARFQKAVKLDSQFAQAHGSLGDCYAQLGRWDEAAVESDRSLELDPTEGDRWWLTATLHAARGDLDGYRRTCKGMLERFGDTDQPVRAERTVKACLLLPDGLGTPDADRVQKLALWAVSGTEHDRLYYWFALAKGLADYRAGRHAEAIQWMERFPLNADGVHWDATRFAVLAMAQHRLGRAEGARACLAGAERTLGKMPDPAKGQPLEATGWQDWLQARVLCREAQALLKQ
jgi:eukaryotic-like serine/threonine-protein kinase